MRSFRRAMPEEVNRVVADHLSDLLLCSSQMAVNHLAKEGITQGVHLVGDVMGDVLLAAAAKIGDPSGRLEALGLVKGEYLLVTVHRPRNTDDDSRLSWKLWPPSGKPSSSRSTLAPARPSSVFLTPPLPASTRSRQLPRNGAAGLGWILTTQGECRRKPTGWEFLASPCARRPSGWKRLSWVGIGWWEPIRSSGAPGLPSPPAPSSLWTRSGSERCCRLLTEEAD